MIGAVQQAGAELCEELRVQLKLQVPPHVISLPLRFWYDVILGLFSAVATPDEGFHDHAPQAGIPKIITQPFRYLNRISQEGPVIWAIFKWQG